mmetsp:Transcript_25912/g.60180  ORF Transcript_25912/g.60180 Transcript_25912/m.60180 type:complete len:294 (-) Transcript_25912:61-942(-)
MMMRRVMMMNTIRRSLRSLSSSSLDTQLYTESLKHVEKHGWTQEAIASAVRSAQLPPMMVGRLTPPQLLERFMRECNQAFSSSEMVVGDDPAETLERAIRERLSYVVPVLKTWHQAMALGALPPQSITTARQLKELVEGICQKAGMANGDEKKKQPWLFASVGAIYVATELHLLADTSPNHVETWSFLHERVQEWDRMRQLEIMPATTLPTRESMVAASAVATSLLGAVASLAQPAVHHVTTTAATAATTTVVPSILSFLQPMSPTTTNDALNDLPPFPTEGTTTANQKETKP